MKNILKTYVKDEIIFCSKCEHQIQAGGRWIQFCPICKEAELNDNDVTHVMSCTHCEKALTILFHEEKDCTYGRCYTKNCGDCFSMQDLTLIPLSEKIPSNSGNNVKVDKLEQILKSIPSKERNMPKDLKIKKEFITVTAREITQTTSWGIPMNYGRCVSKKPTLDQLDGNYE